jgi:hypothetical protein
MTRTIHPIPATSVSWDTHDGSFSTTSGLTLEETHLLVPAEEDASRNLAPAGHSHALIQVLHKRVLLVRRQAANDPRDLGRLRAVQNRDEVLESEILECKEQVMRRRTQGKEADGCTFASSTFGP